MARNKTVRFYLARPTGRPDSPTWPNDLPPLDLVQDAYTGLDYSDGNGELIHRGLTTVGVVQLANDDFLHLRFGRIRRTDLPSGYERAGGQFDELDLPVELAEITDFLFFRNGVIAELPNRDGPSITAALNYIDRKWDFPIDAMMAIRPDVLERLRNADEITLAEIEVPVAQVDQVAEASTGLRNALRRAGQLPSVASVKLVLKPGSDDGAQFLTEWLPIVESLAELPPGVLDSLHVSRKFDGHSERIDLLQQAIKRPVKVEVPAGAANITHEAARAALAKAYNDEAGELQELLA